MTKYEATQALIKFIEDEKRMRLWVFRRDDTKRERKAAACDRALAAVEVLRAAADVREPVVAEQPSLIES